MKLPEIQQRLAAVETEMRTLYDTAEAAGEDLAGEALERWNTLKAERDDLAAKRERAETRDALDRQAEGRQLEQRGDRENGAIAWYLTPEQRMAQFVARQAGQTEQRYSVGRLVRAALTGDWRDAEVERRAMDGVTGTTGGYFLPNPVSASVIDLARNQSAMIRAGAGTIPMPTADLRIVRVLTDPTGYWRGEGQTITESDGTFGSLNLSAYSLAALVRVSNELLDDAPNFAATIDNMLGAALALEMDRVALYGSGAGQPMGLRNASTLNEVSMGDNGATQADYDDLLDLIQKVQEANGSPSVLISSPRSAIKLAKLTTGISGDLTKLTPPAEIAALRKLVSNQVAIDETQGSASTASTTFIGGFENTAFAVRQNVTIEMSRQSDTTFAKNQTHIRAIMRGDFAVLRGSQLGRLIGIL